MRKLVWIILQAAGAPFGIGFAVALFYFTRPRCKLATAAALAFVSVWGDELPAA